MADPTYRHSLTALRAALGGLSAVEYLNQVNRRHRALGFGAMAIRREKVIRWEAGVSTPQLSAQLAMADLHGVPEDAVYELGWPSWLLLAFPADRALLRAPWDLEGTLGSLPGPARDRPADRRRSPWAAGVTLDTIAGDWAAALAAPLHTIRTGRGRVTREMIEGFTDPLTRISRLDDVLGGAMTRRIALANFDVLSSIAREATYDDVTGRLLFSALSESARMCGWLYFDSGLHSAAQSYYVTALRASAMAGDEMAGANALAFMAIQTYSEGDPGDAVKLVRVALDRCEGRATPRLRAMLYSRRARALSKTAHGLTACLRDLDRARRCHALGPHDDDPAWLYWLTESELEMLAASSALSLGRPRQALRSFDAALLKGHSPESYPRDHAIYLTRVARAHLLSQEVEQACDIAAHAVMLSRGLGSERVRSDLARLRTALARHRSGRAVQDFLDLTADLDGIVPETPVAPR
jgi:tetratricopeptide (TPR) repeat protein